MWLWRVVAGVYVEINDLLQNLVDKIFWRLSKLVFGLDCKHLLKHRRLNRQATFRIWDQLRLLQPTLDSALRDKISDVRIVLQLNLFMLPPHPTQLRFHEFLAHPNSVVILFQIIIDRRQQFIRQVLDILEGELLLVQTRVVGVFVVQNLTVGHGVENVLESLVL